MFGGHHNPSTRLNDSWILDPNNFSWRRVKGEEPSTPKNQVSPTGAPAPRAASAAALLGNKIYLYGGHGGIGYARVSFSDLYEFDIETETWTKLEPANTNAQFPEPRGGHSMFANDNIVFIYGGWNSEMQYSNVILYNIETNEFSDPDIYNEIPRWNHTGILVHAIPSKKYFIFGGEQGDFPEGGPRHFGVCTNSACYLDIETRHWSKIETEVLEDGAKPF